MSLRIFPFSVYRRVALGALVSALGIGVLLGTVGLDAPSALAKSKKDEEEVDYLSLAARLIADDKMDRADQMLQQVKLEEQDEDFDLKKYWTLRGLVQLKRGATSDAIESFEKAIAAGQEDPAIYLYLAQAHFSLKNYQATIENLKKAGPAAEENPAGFGIWAQAHWELGQKGSAFDVLNRGIARHPEDSTLLRSKIFYLVELELYQEVVRMSQEYLARPDIGADEYLAISEALRRGGESKTARVILTQAKLKYPKNAQIAVQLAHTYVDQKMPLTAAMVFEDAARLEPKYALEAAELYKEAGRTQLALTLNARVTDQKEKLKQRLAILLESQRYELISGMRPALSRLGLLDDDNVRYALAYAYYKLGDFQKTEEQLRPIKDAGLFRAATQLRKAIANCREAGWECY